MASESTWPDDLWAEATDKCGITPTDADNFSSYRCAGAFAAWLIQRCALSDCLADTAAKAPVGVRQRPNYLSTHSVKCVPGPAWKAMGFDHPQRRHQAWLAQEGVLDPLQVFLIVVEMW